MCLMRLCPLTAPSVGTVLLPLLTLGAWFASVSDRALRTALYEAHHVDHKWHQAIEWYHYNNRNRSDAHVLGVSTYATLVTLVEGKASLDALLSDPATASIDAFGVIGYKVDPDRGRALAIALSIKSAMVTWQQGKMGYSKGMIASDVTFKIFKERGLDMMTFMSQDMAQIGKLFAMGPTTHQDTEAFTEAGDILAPFVNKLVNAIATGALPGEWTEEVKTAIYAAYTVAVQSVPAAERDLAPAALMSDEANAINDGLASSKLGVGVEVKKTDWPHVTRAVLKWVRSRDSGMINSSDARITELLTDLAFIHEIFEPRLRVHALRMFTEKWDGKYAEHALYNYLNGQHLGRFFSRCDGPAGEATDDCALECFHRILKSEGGFDTVEGMGTVVTRMNQVGRRISRDITPCVEAPPVLAKTWKKAQELLGKGWANLAFRMNASFVVPSEKLIGELPASCDTIEKQRAHIKIWVKEYIALRKNPDSYYKLTDGSWDLDILNDYMFSFWSLSEIIDHPKIEALRENGICFTCTCPQFNHYHSCKHSVALALHLNKIKVPVRFSTQVVGKRKAPAGASLSRRGHCLVID